MPFPTSIHHHRAVTQHHPNTSSPNIKPYKFHHHAQILINYQTVYYYNQLPIEFNHHKSQHNRQLDILIKVPDSTNTSLTSYRPTWRGPRSKSRLSFTSIIYGLVEINRNTFKRAIKYCLLHDYTHLNVISFIYMYSLINIQISTPRLWTFPYLTQILGRTSLAYTRILPFPRTNTLVRGFFQEELCRPNGFSKHAVSSFYFWILWSVAYPATLGTEVVSMRKMTSSGVCSI